MLTPSEVIEKILNEEDSGETVRHTFADKRGEAGHMIAQPPSDRKTGTAEWRTKGKGTSDDEGQPVSKAAIKDGKSAGAEDANSHMVAKSPSDNKTGTAQFKTKTAGSEDEGEAVSKKAIKDSQDSVKHRADQLLAEPPSE